MPKVVSRADLLTAHRAILYASGLTPGEKAVGCAIVSHYNEDTGQCDPSATRLAKLIGVRRHTVFAAIAKLQALGILVCHTYGGKAHRNSYAIDWQRCVDLDRAGNRVHRDTVKPKREQCPDGHGEQCPDGHTNVLLTKRSSSLRSKGGVSKIEARGFSGQSAPTRQLHLTHAIAGGKAASHKDAAQGGSERRWQRQLERLSPDERARAVEARLADEDRRRIVGATG